MLRWPDAASVHAAASAWARVAAAQAPEVLRIGYFGSYARGDWGVGSDLDLVVIVEECSEPFERRPLRWDVDGLPVPVDLLVYTRPEWDALREQREFARTVDRDAVWLFRRD